MSEPKEFNYAGTVTVDEDGTITLPPEAVPEGTFAFDIAVCGDGMLLLTPMALVNLSEYNEARRILLEAEDLFIAARGRLAPTTEGEQS